jgi:NAD kinase
MNSEDILEIQKTKTTLKLIPGLNKNYYQTLRQKLHWGTPNEKDIPEK